MFHEIPSIIDTIYCSFKLLLGCLTSSRINRWKESLICSENTFRKFVENIFLSLCCFSNINLTFDYKYIQNLWFAILLNNDSSIIWCKIIFMFQYKLFSFLFISNRKTKDRSSYTRPSYYKITFKVSQVNHWNEPKFRHFDSFCKPFV